MRNCSKTWESRDQPLADFCALRHNSAGASYGPKGGANLAPAQNVFNCNFTTPHRGNLYVYGELGGAFPGTPLSIHAHLAHTGGGFAFPKPFLDYNVGVTAKYKNLALDASVVGTNAKRSECAGRLLCIGARADGAIPPCASSFGRTTYPVGVVSDRLSALAP